MLFNASGHTLATIFGFAARLHAGRMNRRRYYRRVDFS
jgi:hypothetical protein